MRHNTIDFEALRYVLIAAGVGTFGEAAKTVGIKSASLSRRISRVEDELGLTLFERSHAGIRLRSACPRCVPQCSSIANMAAI